MGIWEKLGEIGKFIVDKAPEVMASLEENSIKMQREKNEEIKYQIDDAERKVSKAAKSDKMNNKGYANKVYDANKRISKSKELLQEKNKELKERERNRIFRK